MGINSRKINEEIKTIQNLPRRPTNLLTYHQLQAKFDEASETIIKPSINGIIDDLQSDTNGDSGADNIGMTPIAETGSANKVQTVIEALVTKLKSATVGDSGAHLIGISSISGLVGNTVHAIISSLKTYIDSHKSASTLDHPDGSVTNSKLAPNAVTSDKITDGAAGDLKIGSRTITINGVNLVYFLTDHLNKIWTKIKAITGETGNVYDFSPDIDLKTTKQRLDTADSNLTIHKSSTDHDGRYYTESEINARKFTDIADTPSSYAGKANQMVVVKSDETGVEFSNAFNEHVADNMHLAVTLDSFYVGSDTDYSNAFDRAFTYLNSKGGTLVLSENKTYIVSKQFIVPNNVTIRGNGTGSVISIDPRNWKTGITHFYALFTTVNVTARPQDNYWRFGTGVISHENIQIENIAFQINRIAATLTSGEMDVAEFNAVRFEDAKNCHVKNCTFIDGEDSTNNNGGHLIWLTRSEACSIKNCYFENTTPIAVYESNYCFVENNTIVNSIGTAIETVAGEGHVIEYNKVESYVWNVSAIGINSTKTKVLRNKIAIANLCGIVLGHDEPSGADHYNVLQRADYAECCGNIIENGSATTGGYSGIILQNGTHVTIENNKILSLQKGATYTNVEAGIIVSGAGTVDRFTDITIKNNFINHATGGIHLRDGDYIFVENNYITDVVVGVYSAVFLYMMKIDIIENKILNADRAITLLNAHSNISDNRFDTILNVNFSLALELGYYKFKHNYLNECGEIFFSKVKKLVFADNIITKVTPTTRAALINNVNTAGTASMDNIAIENNVHPGTTNLIYFQQVLNQTDRYVETTRPTIYRKTSYNVGTLPTANTGLLAGDLWNNAGVVTVV